MSITADGERSRQRLWFAKKRLRDARRLGLPSSTIKVDGFTYRVLNMSENYDVGRVTAPMGAVVACSVGNEVQVAQAEYWLGGFSQPVPVHIPSYIPQWGVQNSHYLINMGDVAYAKEVFVSYPTSQSTPVVSPYFGEVYSLGLAGFTVEGKEFAMWGASLYADTGSSETAQHAVGNSHPYFGILSSIAQPMKLGAALFHSVAGGDIYSGACTYHDLTKLFILGHFYGYSGKNALVGTIYAQPFFADLPARFKDKLTTYVEGVNPPINYCACSFTLDYADGEGSPIFVCALYTGLVPFCDGLSPSSSEGIACKAMADDISSVLITMDYADYGTRIGITGLNYLFNLLYGPGHGNGSAGWVAKYFGYPNTLKPGIAAADTTMFIAHNNAIYSWTRNDGIVSFNKDGMHIISGIDGSHNTIPSASCVVPDLVYNTPGVRPNISHAGGGWYACICENTSSKYEVVGLFIGSIFGSWFELPLPEFGVLLNARPVEVMGEIATFLGVVDTGEGTSFAVLKYGENGGDWKQLGPLPFEAAADARWSVSLYGDGDLVNKLAQYPSPPSPTLILGA